MVDPSSRRKVLRRAGRVKTIGRTTGEVEFARLGPPAGESANERRGSVFACATAIAVITLNNPPVNGLGNALRAGIAAGLERRDADPDVKAVVLIGTGKVFSGGADIREFNKPHDASPTCPRSSTCRTRCTKPLVAAIGGFALGGGLELALACHYRVAVEKTRAGAARGEARHPAGLGRHAAPAAHHPRARGRAHDDPGRSDFGAAREGAGPGRRDRGRRPARGRARLREKARRGGQGPATHPRPAAQGGRRPEGRARGGARAGREERERQPGARRDRQVQSRPRSRCRSTRAARSSASASNTSSTRCESKALRHMFFAERQTSKIPDVPEDTPVRDIKQGRRRRRRHHGRRHRDELRQRRHPGGHRSTNAGGARHGHRSASAATTRRRCKRGRLKPDEMDEALALIQPSTRPQRDQATPTS